MKFDLISDFHVEMNPMNVMSETEYDVLYPWGEESKSDVLVIAGDSANDPISTMTVLSEAAMHYQHVVFTDGNHEHYNGYRTGETVGMNMEKLRDFAMSDKDRITYLDGIRSARFGDVLFIGANGWYDFKANKMLSRDAQHSFWKSDSNDSKAIRYDPQGYPDKLALSQAKSLAFQVERAQDDDSIREIIVVTHTVPHEKGGVPDTHPWGYLNGAYHNTEMHRVVDADVNQKISTWVFGHTHFFYDFDDGHIRYVNNPRGYRGERRSPTYESLVQIDTTVRGSAFAE